MPTFKVRTNISQTANYISCIVFFMNRAITFKLTCAGLVIITGEDRLYIHLFVWGYVSGDFSGDFFWGLQEKIDQASIFLSGDLFFQGFVFFPSVLFF